MAKTQDMKEIRAEFEKLKNELSTTKNPVNLSRTMNVQREVSNHRKRSVSFSPEPAKPERRKAPKHFSSDEDEKSPFEEMSRKELIETCKLLTEKLQTTTGKLARAKTKFSAQKEAIKTLEEDKTEAAALIEKLNAKLDKSLAKQKAMQARLSSTLAQG